MAADLDAVLERLDSFEARVNSRFDTVEGRFDTQREQIKELSGNFEKLIHVVNDRFDKLDPKQAHNQMANGRFPAIKLEA